MYDIVIVGSGPAGLSAAITARSRNKEVLLVSNDPFESPLAKAPMIDNYPGLPQINGTDLLNLMIDHAKNLGATFAAGKVISILPMGDSFSVTTSDEIYQGESVILTTGLVRTKPFPGETEYLGRGVSYCATCDGMLYRKATICVVGLTNDAVEEANFLQEIGCAVTFLSKKEPEGLSENIEVRTGTAVEIQGDALGVTGLVYKDSATKEMETLPCSGVFILRSAIAPDALIMGLPLKEGYIVVDKDMNTPILGVFAAGDCVGKPAQVAKAVGEGQAAGFSAVAFLDR